MEEKITKLCKEILNNNHCPNCAGTYEGSSCRFCGHESEILKNLENELISCLSDGLIINENILKSLYSIRTLKISKVTEILSQYHFTEVLESKYQEIASKCSKEVLSSGECSDLLYLLESGYIKEEDKKNFIDVLMKHMLSDKLNVSMEEKLSLIQNFAEIILKGKVKHPKVSFQKLSDDTLGNSLYYIINLDLPSIVDSLNQKNYFDILETVFHECTHTYQDYIISEGKEASYLSFLQSQENAIRFTLPGYYDANYESYSKEVEARCSSYLLSAGYLSKLGLGLKKESSKHLESLIEREQSLLQNETRTVDGKPKEVTEIFETYVQNPLFLSRFPLLKIAYRIENGKIVRKSLSELKQDYENYQMGNSSLRGNQDEIEYLYNRLFEKSQKHNERR